MSDTNKRGTPGAKPSPAAKKPGARPSAAKRPGAQSAAAKRPAAPSGSSAGKRATSPGGASVNGAKKNTPSGKASKAAGADHRQPSKAQSGRTGAQAGKPRPSGKSASASGSARPAGHGMPPKAGRPQSRAPSRQKPAAQRQDRKKEDVRRKVADEELRNSPEAAALEERREQRHSQKRSSLYRSLYFIAVSIAIVTVAFVLSMTILFHISTINVEIGEGVPYSEAEIIEASGVSEGRNLLALSLKDASQGIMYSLPYIEHAEVRRQLPSTVNIKTESAEILGLALNSDKQLVVLSTSGKALEVLHGNKPSNMPVINGMIVTKAEVGRIVELENPEQLDIAAQVVKCFLKNDLEPDSLTFSPTGSTVSAVYDKRIDIKLGAVSGLDEKLELASLLIKEGKISEGEAGILDLTIKGRATFRPNYVEENSGQLDFVYEPDEETDEPEESSSDVYDGMEEETP